MYGSYSSTSMLSFWVDWTVKVSAFVLAVAGVNVISDGVIVRDPFELVGKNCGFTTTLSLGIVLSLTA